MTPDAPAAFLSALTVLSLTGGCAYALYISLGREGRPVGRGVVRQIRWWMIPLALLTLALTGGTSYLLSLVPPLRWGWWQAIGNHSPSPEMAYFEAPILIPIALIINLCVLIATPFVCWLYEIGFRARPAVEERGWSRRIGWAALSGCPIILFGGSLHVGLAWGLCHGGMTTALYIRAFRQTQCQLRHASNQLRKCQEQLALIEGSPTDRAPASWSYRPVLQRQDIASLAALGSAAFSTVYFWLASSLSIAIALAFGVSLLG